MSTIARKGQIARLPHVIREEVNTRLLEGQSGSKILPWLNKLPEVIAILDADFDGLKIKAQNLSEWRKGGYEDWLQRRRRVDETKDLAMFSAELGKARGQSLSDGAAAIASGKLLTILEGLTSDDELDPDTFETLIRALSALRKGDHDALKIAQNKIRLKQFGEGIEMERKKFQRTTCELFIDWATTTKALDIAQGDAPREAKIESLGKLMFAELWDQEPKK
jgi:hypothetical protein